MVGITLGLRNGIAKNNDATRGGVSNSKLNSRTAIFVMIAQQDEEERVRLENWDGYNARKSENRSFNDSVFYIHPLQFSIAITSSGYITLCLRSSVVQRIRVVVRGKNRVISLERERKRIESGIATTHSNYLFYYLLYIRNSRYATLRIRLVSFLFYSSRLYTFHGVKHQLVRGAFCNNPSATKVIR